MTESRARRFPAPVILPPTGNRHPVAGPTAPVPTPGTVIQPVLSTLLEAAELGMQVRPGRRGARAFAEADRAYRRTRDDTGDEAFFDFTV